MTLTCGCDMPIEIYADWLQDQGWDTDELRQEGDPVVSWDYVKYDNEGCAAYIGAGDGGEGDGFGSGKGDGYFYFIGNSHHITTYFQLWYEQR